MTSHGDTEASNAAPPGVPPQGTLSYQSIHVGGRRPWAVSEIVAWVAVILMVSGIAVLVALSQRTTPRDPEAADTALSITTQYMVGVNSLAPGQFSSLKGQFMGDIDREAKSSADRFRAAIAAGELLGKEEGRQRMAALTAGDQGLAEDAGIVRALYDGEAVTDTQWSSFQKKYGWFAELARSSDKPAGDPQRAEVLNRSYRTLGVVVGFFAGVGFMLFTGMGLLILAIVLWSKGRIKPAFTRGEFQGAPPPFADRRHYIQGFALYLFCVFAFGMSLRLILTWAKQKNPPLWIELIPLMAAFAIGVGWPLLMRQTFAQWRIALGLYSGRGILREMFSGVLGYLAGLPLIAVGVLLFALLARLTGINSTHPITEELGGSWLNVFLAFVLASVFAPISEELMFRGALFAHLRERFGWWVSAPTVGVIFAIIHPQGWIALPVLGTIGFVFCGIREWRGSIIGCMTAHALHNTMALIFALSLLR